MNSNFDFDNLLFRTVQESAIFIDSKTFPDCIPLKPYLEIEKAFLIQKESKNFDLKIFVFDNFKVPQIVFENFETDPSRSPKEHIEELWPFLQKNTKNQSLQSTIISLPHDFVVPGGRFQEVYYWDSYFTMLGLKESGKQELIQQMIDNFAFQINEIGHIPNANRTYFLSRSQPPFFTLMLDFIGGVKKREMFSKYVTTVEKEYSFWMDSREGDEVYKRLVNINGVKVNRYFDDTPKPRPESYIEDVELAQKHDLCPENLYVNIRAACESGWDFSSRWLENPQDLSTIHTCDFIPVDLNCLLYHSEVTLHEYFKGTDSSKAELYAERAEQRMQFINTYCWCEKTRFYYDYDFVEGEKSEVKSLAGLFPLFLGIANSIQAEGVEKVLKAEFLKQGGLITTTIETGQQWDSPNGWAPLQWISYVGLKKYGFEKTANQVRENWLSLNDKVYHATGKFTEKYNVSELENGAGGGEYPNQDGFGWTNGVYLALLRETISSPS